MNTVRRVFVEKRPGFDLQADLLLTELQEVLHIPHLTDLRIFKRFDLSGLSEEEFSTANKFILAESNADRCYDSLPDTASAKLLNIELLPGQFDALSAAISEAIKLISAGETCALVHCSTIYAFYGLESSEDLGKIRDYLLNPIECRLAKTELPESLELETEEPADVKIIEGFIKMSAKQLQAMADSNGLGMDIKDLLFCQKYFRDEEQRDPSYTELKVIDTYWSDHCRHTTFNTEIKNVEFTSDPLDPFNKPIREDFQTYLSIRKSLNREDKPLCLMDLATIAARELKKQGKLDNHDESEEVNACSIIVEAEIEGKVEPWLIMFKNETHNHPTEIEPFGGAATCLGGAIRDPLSGRAYVYQAMRISGSGDPRTPIENTLPGKLPQRKITLGAAAGYSSYANQIGLPAGKVKEYYHPGFVAKRMELGAVVAAAPAENVHREAPVAGDLVILIGGRTGRDGCGGAIGSSRAHTDDSMLSCAAEVQKGNPSLERNIQRLFRRSEFAKKIKRCNDFGAGGVSVAIGELADGLKINLDKVPVKYPGLDGTELAISESQERMAIVIAAADLEQIMAMVKEESLEAALVAEVTEEARLRIFWQDKAIVDISRAFLDSSGVSRTTDAVINSPDLWGNPFLEREVGDLKETWLDNLQDINSCSQKGLAERFDASGGGLNVLLPYGGKTRLTANEAMVSKLPVEGQTNCCTMMSHGYDPKLCAWSPYHGALYAVVSSVAKLVAAGADFCDIRLTFQEYFESLQDDPERWGKPLVALLGALRAQLGFGCAAIGGKDSMSGSFNELSVPPTLVSFAVAPGKADKIISPEFKGAGHAVGIITVERDSAYLPDFAKLCQQYGQLSQWIDEGLVLAAHSVGYGGIAATLSKMCFGNWLGVAIDSSWSPHDLFKADYGAIIIESSEALPGVTPLGATSAAPYIMCNDMILDLEEASVNWQKPLESVFPVYTAETSDICWQPCIKKRKKNSRVKFAKPRVFIPALPGLSCENDLARAFANEGAIIDWQLFHHMSKEEIQNSLENFAASIEQAQIIAFPSGFMGPDEMPDFPAKLMATIFRYPQLIESMNKFLQERDGLILGLGSGFQTLLKLGLLPYGEIRQELSDDSPALGFNSLGRYVSSTINTIAVSTLSPWLSRFTPGQLISQPFSNAAGRFYAEADLIQKLFNQGQVAFQYADSDGKPAVALPWNPSGSVCAIEAITSQNGRILGKMGSSERFFDPQTAINIPEDKEQSIFAAGIEFFS